MEAEQLSYGLHLFEQMQKFGYGVFLKAKFDKDFTITVVGRECTEIFGYSPEEITYNHIISFDHLVHPDDRKWLRNKRQEQIDHQLPMVNEYRIITKQGRTKWVKEIVSYQQIESDNLMLEAFVQDITPYKLNAFMSNAFTSYQNAVNNGSIVSITDKEGKLLFVNEHFCTVSQYSRIELIGKDISIINSDYHDKSFFQEMWKTLLKGKIWRGQVKNRNKSGGYYWVDTVISPILNENGELDQFLSITNNITDQKDNEYALIESEALNRTIIKSLHTKIAIVDEDGKVEKVNENWLESYKQSKMPLLCKVGPGENYFNRLNELRDHGDIYANKLRNGIESVLTNQTDFFELEYPCITPEGEKWYFAHISKFEKDVKRIIISNFDISQRKNQEEILRKNEARLNEAQRIAKIGSWEHDIEKDIMIGSKEIFAIFGLDYLPAPSSYSDFLLSVHPEDRLYVDQAYKYSLEKRQPYNIVHRIILPDGNIKFVNEQCETFYNDKGKPYKSIGTTQDVTEQKNFEISLETERLRYQNVVENISDGLIIDDIDGKVTFANRRFLEMIGITESDLPDFEFIDYVAPEFKEDIISRHKKRMEGEDVSTVFEYIGLKKDGERRWFEARVTKIEEGGVIKGTQSAIRDVTEAKESLDLLKASEAEKTKLLNELTKRYNELMQFNYIVSHNLRAPIANLMGLSEIFNMPTLEEEERVKIIGHIQVSIQKIDELIQDLNIILAARSDINSKKEIVDFESTISSIKHTLEKQIIDSNTFVRVHIADNARTVFSIKSYVKSILYNLINNSIKYKAPDRHPEIMIDVSRVAQTIVIKITDNGLGIDLEKYGKEVFGLYKRFNLNVEGKGLGLNMTKTQVEALGGTIEISSQPEIGTTFIISIPESEM